MPIPPCPAAEHHQKEPGAILLAPTLEIFVRIDGIPSQPSHLQINQAQLWQPLLTREILQTPNHLCYSEQFIQTPAQWADVTPGFSQFMAKAFQLHFSQVIKRGKSKYALNKAD